ncbi:MAG: integration host factor subunit alpha [Deltaproteobacteria bacterium]|nr:integration host factor subunit alpha [Deltaproteobacteria bacterium]
MTLIKEHLVRSTYDNVGLSKSKSSEAVERVFEIMRDTLASGEDVLISGFGKFCVKEKSERRGRNPATGHDMVLGARRVVTFRCSPVLRNKILDDDEATF